MKNSYVKYYIEYIHRMASHYEHGSAANFQVITKQNEYFQ